MSDNPRPVQRAYTLEDRDWQNAFGDPDSHSGQRLRQDALQEMDKSQSPAYQAMKQSFAQIDRDKDGFLNPEEISQAAKNIPDLQGLADDWQAQFNIKRLVNDGRNDGRGISMNDVDAFGAREVAANHAQNDPSEFKLAAEFADKYFDKISRESPGFITRRDLDQLIDDPSLKVAFRQKFLLMERYFEPISELHKDKILRRREHDGLSREDIKALVDIKGDFRNLYNR